MKVSRQLATKSWSCASALLLALLGSSRAAMATDFRLFHSAMMIPERGLVECYLLQAATNWFSFLPPPGWKVAVDPAERTVEFTAPKLDASLKLRFRPDVLDAGAAESNLAQLRELVRQAHSDARITAEFPAFAGNLEGTAFELERATERGFWLRSRLVFLRTESVLVEINLTAGRPEFAGYRQALGTLLTSFGRAEAPRGGSQPGEGN